MKSLLILQFLISLTMCTPKISEENNNLRFLRTRIIVKDVNATFRIGVFADLMYGTDSDLNAQTQAFQYQALEYYNTTVGGIDLAVVLGNAVDGTKWNGTDNNYFQDRWDMVMAPFVYYGVRVAFTFGDRDALSNLKHTDDIIEYLYSYSDLAMTYIASSSYNGSTFYTLPIHSSLNNNHIVLNLVFFDSNTYDCNEKEQSEDNHVGCVSPTQIQGARKYLQYQKDKFDKDVTNYVFSHQPIQQYELLWRDENSQVYGEAHDQVTCDSDGSQLMAKLLDDKYRINLFVSGKDMDNAFIAIPYQTTGTQTNFAYAGGAGFTGQNKTLQRILMLTFTEKQTYTNLKQEYFLASGVSQVPSLITADERVKFVLNGCNEYVNYTQSNTTQDESTQKTYLLQENEQGIEPKACLNKEQTNDQQQFRTECL